MKDVLQKKYLVNLIVSIFSLGALLSCGNMIPKSKYEKNNKELRGTISLAFDQSSMNFLAQRIHTVRVSIYRVKAEEIIKPAEKSVDSSDGVEQTEYNVAIKDVSLGLKEFVVELLGEDRLVIATGRARHMVVVGNQTLSRPIIIKISGEASSENLIVA